MKKLKVHHEHLDLSIELKKYGGKFPDCKGKKYRYPKPHEHEKWLKLLACAYTYRNKMRHAKTNSLKPPQRNFKLEYALYHCRKEQILRRSKRNKHRKIIGNKMDLEGKDIHHTDRKNLSLHSALVLTEKQHQEIHRREKNSKIRSTRPTLVRGSRRWFLCRRSKWSRLESRIRRVQHREE